MGAIELYDLTWPEVRQEIDNGRDTIVLSLGAVEQHGHHLPLGTDAILGEVLGRALADRLNAFHAPTMPIGCSRHHLAFPGTMSVEEETLQAVVEDVILGWARHGFKRIVLLPTHGGNFEPLARALARLGPVEGVNVIGISDLGLLVQATLALGTEFGIPASEGGLHAGQWETSMLLAVRPELVHMERAVPGYTGDPEAGLKTFFEKGTDALTETGVIGDPRRASADHGRRYAERLVELATEYVAERS